MKFYSLEEVPVSGGDHVFKVSPAGKGVAALIFFGIAIACLVFAVYEKNSGVIPYFVAAAVGLIGLIPLSQFRATLRPTNWLVRCNDTGIIIKYRAFENWKLPATDAQAVGLDYSEIAWVKMVRERRTKPSTRVRSGTEVSLVTYVDLGLVNPDTAELEKHLKSERDLRPIRGIMIMDYPVQAMPDGIVEIRWSGGVRPSVEQAIALLGQRLKIAEAEQRTTDLTFHRDASPEDARGNILTLARSGDQFGAIRLAQQAFGYSVGEAKQFVDKLQAGE